MIKKIVMVFGYITIILLLVITMLNLIYMSGYIDFYKPELTTYNSENDLSQINDKDTILIMGDSFSAGNSAYPNILRYIFPEYRIINSALPGTGVIQASILAEQRIKRFKPKIFIYQTYIGNDLIDITYPVNIKKISSIRNLYWLTAGNFRVVSYINYRLGQVMASRNEKYTKYTPSEPYDTNTEKFSVKKYSKRDVLYIKADNQYIENTILLKGKRKNDFNILIAKLDEIFNLLDKDCIIIIVPIPHASQLNKSYLNKTSELGAIFSKTNSILDAEYPFIKNLREQFNDAVIINPLIYLRNAEERGTRVYYQNDSHLNLNGQKILADTIALYIKDINLMESEKR